MDAAAETAERPRPGPALAAERERQGLSRTEVAQRLHMSPSQIEALETDDYGRLPRGPFLRGFLRNYAKLLGLDPEPMLAMLAEPQEAAPRIVVPSQNIRFDPLGERLANPYLKAGAAALVVVALAFAAMYWWLFIKPTPPAAVARKPAAAQPGPLSGPPQQLAEAPMAPATAPPATQTPVTEPADAPVQVASPAPPAAPEAEPRKPAPGERVLRFRFSGESWVEVRDARDRVLFARLNPAGSQAEVAARPPVSVVVGNAPEVEMTYDGRPFALAPHTKVAVARFTLE